MKQNINKATFEVHEICGNAGSLTGLHLIS